jgi:hypothetical protein
MSFNPQPTPLPTSPNHPGTGTKCMVQGLPSYKSLVTQFAKERLVSRLPASPQQLSEKPATETSSVPVKYSPPFHSLRYLYGIIFILFFHQCICLQSFLLHDAFRLKFGVYFSPPLCVLHIVSVRLILHALITFLLPCPEVLIFSSALCSRTSSIFFSFLSYVMFL